MNKTITRTSLFSCLLVTLLSLTPGTNSAASQGMSETELAMANVIGVEGVERMNEVIRGVMGGDPSFLNEASKREVMSSFRKIADFENMSEDEFQVFTRYMRIQMTGLATELMPLFWEDALWAYRKQEFFKSTMRNKVERQYLGYGVISQARVDQNDEIIAKIARRIPINVQGTEVVFDEAVLTATIENIKTVQQRIEWLFSFE